jgi:hypothetical protein
MLLAAREAGAKRFVYAASSSTYRDHPGMPKQEDIIGRPLSPYAVTKYVNELYADVFARVYGLESIGLRYFNVFGPRQDPNGAYAAVIPKWTAAMIAGEDVYINGDGETSRDFCYIANAVQANLLAATVTDPAAVTRSTTSLSANAPPSTRSSRPFAMPSRPASRVCAMRRRAIATSGRVMYATPWPTSTRRAPGSGMRPSTDWSMGWQRRWTGMWRIWRAALRISARTTQGPSSQSRCVVIAVPLGDSAPQPQVCRRSPDAAQTKFVSKG